MRGSLRTQLVWGNVAALALLLAVLGAVVHYAAAAAILASIDRELDARTRPHGVLPGRGNGPPAPIMGSQEGKIFLPPPLSGGRGGLFSPPGEPGGGLPARGNGGPFHDGGRPDDGPPQFGHHRPPADDPYGPFVFTAQGAGLGSHVPWDASVLAEASAGQVVFSTVRVNSERLRVVSRPFPAEGPRGRVLQAAYPLADADRALSGLNMALLILLPFALLCAGAVGTLLTGRVLRRVGEMTGRVARMGADDLSARLPAVGEDEFAALAGTVNGLLARLETAFARQQQLMEQQRRFTADASHELKTPLTVIRGSTSFALSGQPSQEQYREMMADMDGAAQQMARLVADLLLLARADAGNLALSRERVSLPALVEEVAARARCPGLASVTVQAAPNVPAVSGNTEELARVLSNLLDNALRHTAPDGQVTVTVRGDAHGAVVTVADTGTGIDARHLPHLGERFYRVDGARARQDGGTGLGLSICRGIVDAHGGTLTIDSTPGVGTTVTVRLPTQLDKKPGGKTPGS